MADASSLASWVSEVATPATQRSWSLTHGSPCTANSTFASDSAIGYEDGLEIVAGNADEWLYYDSRYRVLVCRYHGYAVRNLATHLRLQHKVRSSERAAIEKKFGACELLEPAQVTTPPTLQAPLDWLGAPMRGYLCDEPGCSKISISRDEIRKHCYKEHAWKSNVDDPEHWHAVYVQTMFQSKAHRRYFVVDYHDESVREAEQSKDGMSSQSQQVIEDWDRRLEQQEEAMQVAEATMAKTDHTLWFKRNKWPQHLAKSNLRHLSRACCLPGRDEGTLEDVPKRVEGLVEECVKGLPTLGHVIRRWLRSAKASEPDARPMARLQNEDSQKRYAGYMTRFVCYTLRVWESCEATGLRSGEEEDGEDEDGEEEGGEEEGGEEEDDIRGATGSNTISGSTGSGIREIDTMEDARRLYPWPSGLYEIVGRLWRALSPSRRTGSPEMVMLEFFRHVLFQHVRVDVFESPLLHFLAVLGIDEETHRLREGNDFSFMLAGIVYSCRVLGVEIILPKTFRRGETAEDDERFLELRLKHLADGSFSPMAEMISLLAYSRHCAFNHANAGAVSWSLDGSTIAYRGRKIPLARVRKLVDAVVTEAENILWRDVLWQVDSERFEIPVDALEDDVTFTRRGYSFLNNAHNGLEDTRAWMLAQMEAHVEGRKLLRRGRWQRRETRKYLRRVDHFRELLLLCVHWTGGQPARGTEITSVRYKNGYMQDRNVFAVHGHMAVVTRYHKSASQYDQPKVVPRFLAWRVGQLMAVYLAYARPLQELLAGVVNGQMASEYIWSGEHGPWETDRLTRVMKRETGRHLGVELTTHSYRHLAIAIGRKVIGEQFANGYLGDVDDFDEPEEETDDSLEMQAGRGGEVGAKRYGVSMDIIKNLSSRSIDTFRPLCQQWHRFLALESCRAEGGTKRKRQDEHEDGDVGREPRTDVLAAFKRMRRNWQGRCPREDDGQDRLRRAMQKALCKSDVSFRSETQREALETIVEGGRRPLVVVMPTGGGKSLLFTAPACLDSTGVTIVVVPFRALINDLVEKAKKAGIDSVEWRPGEVNPATIVFASADLVDGTNLLGYAQQLLDSGRLRRIFIDECHLIFKENHWRAKLARLSCLRGVDCPFVLLTATLPPRMQFELERCMAIEFCRYIRADTTRERTRYMVEECKPGKLERRAIEICHSWVEANRVEASRRSKGVVYCRSRAECETLADELGCAYYHAEADGREERIFDWAERGGLIVATSALGTGVDFPGITLVLHVDIPWGMIDFAQESGRAGRAGEDVDSVIVIEKGRIDRMRHKMQNPDEQAMLDFVRARGCRRKISGSFLDGMEHDCVSDERGLARCDNCGDGWTALERRQRQTSETRARVERVLSELVDDCPVCWVEERVSCNSRGANLPRQVNASTVAGTCGFEDGVGDSAMLNIRFDRDTHSCFRCGLSQKFCNTGQSTGAECQWPNIAAPMLRAIRQTRKGAEILEGWEFSGEEAADGQDGGYVTWLGRRHARRVLGEGVSKGFAHLVEFISQQHREMAGADNTSETEGQAEDTGDEVTITPAPAPEASWKGSSSGQGQGGNGDMRSLESDEIVRRWERGCVVCRARGRDRTDHAWQDCQVDADHTEAAHEGVRLINSLQAPLRTTGFRCWAKGKRCRCWMEGRRGGCSGSAVICSIVGALLYVGGLEVREWVQAQEAFTQAIKEGKSAQAGLEKFLSTKGTYGGQKCAGVDALIVKWGI
jgi:superfamily II DNA/RNA helicase